MYHHIHPVSSLYSNIVLFSECTVFVREGKMRRENPNIFNLRTVTTESIETLYCSGRFSTYKEVCIYVFNKTNKQNISTGFNMESLDKFYNQFRKHKSKITENNPNEFNKYKL